MVAKKKAEDVAAAVTTAVVDDMLRSIDARLAVIEAAQASLDAQLRRAERANLLILDQTRKGV